MKKKVKDGILLKFSVGIGNNIASAEEALMLAKKNKNKNNLYNIYVNDSNRKDIDNKNNNMKSLEKSYSKLKKFILKNNPSLVKDLDVFKYDQKTGLLNRIGYFIELEQLKLKKSNRLILFFDADDMHDVNEKYFYEKYFYDFVDKYLIEIGKTLNKNIRCYKKDCKKKRGFDILGYNSKNTIFHRKNDSAGDEFIVNIEYNKKDCDLAKKIAKRYLDNIYLAQKELSKKLGVF
jgi:GGDEF domain-containing protein